MKKITSLTIFLTCIFVSEAFSQIKVGNDIPIPYSSGSYLTITMSLNGERIAIADLSEDLDTAVLRLFQLHNSEEWLELGNGISTNSFLSASLTADGTKTLVRYIDSVSGHDFTSLYYWDDWDEPVKIGNDLDLGEYSTMSNIILSPDGNKLAHGFIDDNYEEHGVIIYEWINETWINTSPPLVGGILGFFGRLISFSGNSNRIAINAGNYVTSNKTVSIYEKQGTEWVQIGNTLIFNAGTFPIKSIQLSYDGNRIGILGGGDIIQTFELVGSEWIEYGAVYDGVHSPDYLSISSDFHYLVYGYNNSTNDAFAKSFEYNDDSYGWIERGTEVEEGKVVGGTPVAISGNGLRFSIGSTVENYVSVYEFQPTAIKELPNSININTFPNPVRNELNIDLGNTYNNVFLTIRNVVGHTIYMHKYQDISLININLETILPVGAYIAEISLSSKNPLVFKFMKE